MAHATFSPWLLGLIVTLAGCAALDSGRTGGQTGSESFGCVPVTTTPLAPTEISPLGFSAEDVLSLAEGSHQSTLTWADGRTTGVAIEVRHDQAAPEFVDNEWRDDGSGREPALEADCEDEVVVEVALDFVTEGGEFDESSPATLRASVRGSSALSLPLPLEALRGTYEVSGIDVGDSEIVTLSFDIAFDDGGVTGTISGQVATDPSASTDPDAPVSETAFDVATF